MGMQTRKLIRLQGYDYAQNGVYFITVCSHNRVHWLGEIVGAHLCVRPEIPKDAIAPDKMVEKWLLEIEHKYINTKILKYVIMPNHIHFLIWNPGTDDTKTGAHIGAPLQEIMKWFKTQTTNEYIRGVKRGWYPAFDQHIWQRSYYDHIVRSRAEYRQIWQYIEENPLKWELDCYYHPEEMTSVPHRRNPSV
mgnify:CR=1 FL=1